MTRFHAGPDSPRPAVPANTHAGRTARGGAPTVLVVDSHDGSRHALAGFLAERGYDLVQAHNGMAGLRAARKRPPALVVVDLWPFFSASLQMVERLRRDAATARVPVLVVTSAVAADHRRRALAAGCAGYLEKPCPPERVLAEMCRILSPAPAGAERPATIREIGLRS